MTLFARSSVRIARWSWLLVLPALGCDVGEGSIPIGPPGSTAAAPERCGGSTIPVGSECQCSTGGVCEVVEVTPPMRGVQVTACVMGTTSPSIDPFDTSSDAVLDNRALAFVCDRLPGIVRYEGHPGFRKSVNERDAARTIEEALQNAGADRGVEVELNIVSYSWGAYTAVNILEKLEAMRPGLRVRRFVSIDPYMIDVGLRNKAASVLPLPENVQFAFNVRHSRATDDSSEQGEFFGTLVGTGAYTGRPVIYNRARSRCLSADLSRTNADPSKSVWGHGRMPALCADGGGTADQQCSPRAYKERASRRSIIEEILDGRWHPPAQTAEACLPG